MLKKVCLLLVICATLFWPCRSDAIIVVLNADVNSDWSINITDMVQILDWLFENGPQPLCWGAADANGDNHIDLADPTYIGNYLFNGGSPPVPEWIPLDKCDDPTCCLNP